MEWKTWAIDEETVKADGYTFEEMFYRQARVPVYMLVLLMLLTLLLDVPVHIAALVGLPFVLFGAWPAYSCYVHWKRGDG